MGIVTGKQDAAMTSTNGQHATEVSDGLPLPPAQDQELLLDAWREALGLALYEPFMNATASGKKRYG
jgi:hypothetical protein